MPMPMLDLVARVRNSFEWRHITHIRIVVVFTRKFVHSLLFNRVSSAYTTHVCAVPTIFLFVLDDMYLHNHIIPLRAANQVT